LNIWVIGSVGTKADKHIEWVYAWPNFSDFDVLIINLASLAKETLQWLEIAKVNQAERTIADRVKNGGIVIVIAAPLIIHHSREKYHLTNYQLTPFSVRTTSVETGNEIKYNEQHFFLSYLKDVKKFKFIIDEISLKINPSAEFSDCQIKNKAGNYLGSGYKINEGEAFLLPPTEYVTNDDINKIIECFKKPDDEKRDPPPDWVSNVELTGIKEINNKIQELSQIKSNLETELQNKQAERKKLEKYYGLLYLQNKQLENCVRDAFTLLGFNEIKRIRGDELEDWVIDFQTIKGQDHGIIEVKGRNEKTTQADIVQCNKWADDYRLMDPPKNVKGIFISNQFRLESYPQSRDKRTKFEPNELSFAASREICIIPTYVLFEAVNNALQGKKKSRDEIEKLLFETNGVLTDL
jgi:hypothetical protein